MAIPTLNAVGFCAHYSDPGDWAFDYALQLSRAHQVRLNVFHFRSDPYDPDDTFADSLSDTERAKLAIEREKELRMYYDKRAGDYLEVGFRLCEHAEWVELHRCLVVREFQLLVLGYVEKDVSFGRRPIEEFADAFVCPVVLVGPDRPDQLHLNSRAELIIDKLGLQPGGWSLLDRQPAG
ncbi:universal stress protein [bacterium]|nr:universal stress protein [bacterium]